MPGRSHPIFARVYAALSRAEDRAGLGRYRDELLAGVAGAVIEVGAGNGMNFRHYPEGVSRIVAVEPDPFLRERASREAARAPVPVSVVAGVAEALPAAEASFDVVVLSLVLCSVADPRRALVEARRVLRPGGEVRFYEHVVSDSSGHARAQRALDLVWPRFTGGCHTARSTVAAIEAAGFETTALRRFEREPRWLTYPVSPHVIGRARARTA